MESYGKKAAMTSLVMSLLFVGILIAGTIAVGTIPAGADTGVGRAFPTVSWDRTMDCTKKTCPRFLVLTNMNSEAVLDRETGLVWEQSPDIHAYEWRVALARCGGLTKGGRLGWRLPTIQELASLIEATQSTHSLPSGHPFSYVQLNNDSFYWSANTSVDISTGAWGMYFSVGPFVLDKGTSGYVWCVRGGQGVDPQ